MITSGSMSPSARTARIVFVAASLSLVACRRESADVREWTRTDHDNQEKPNAGQIDPAQKRPEMPSLQEHGVDDVVLATWKQNCIVCHGVIGRGDGPQAAMVKPPNFTDPEWQRVHLDDEMARTIQKGRGKMPGFTQLPAETVNGLVQLIRLLNPERHRDSGAPSDSASNKSGSTEKPSSTEVNKK